MIMAANICKKASRFSKRHARISFWSSEGRTLRRKYRALITGAAVLTVVILSAHILLCTEILRALHLVGVSEEICRVLSGAFIVFGIILFSLLNTGGRHLALKLYRQNGKSENQKITVGELFYSFGSQKRRQKSACILYSDLKKCIYVSVLTVIPLMLYATFGWNAAVIAVTSLCALITLFPSPKNSLEWIFELKKHSKESYRDSRSMSGYAVFGREKELKKMKNKSRFRFILGVIIPFGLAFIYFPYTWTSDAVCAECVSLELVSSSV